MPSIDHKLRGSQKNFIPSKKLGSEHTNSEKIREEGKVFAPHVDPITNLDRDSLNDREGSLPEEIHQNHNSIPQFEESEKSFNKFKPLMPKEDNKENKTQTRSKPKTKMKSISMSKTAAPHTIDRRSIGGTKVDSLHLEKTASSKKLASVKKSIEHVNEMLIKKKQQEEKLKQATLQRQNEIALKLQSMNNRTLDIKKDKNYF